MYGGHSSLKNVTLWGWTEQRFYSCDIALDIKGALEQKFVHQQMLLLLKILSFLFLLLFVENLYCSFTVKLLLLFTVCKPWIWYQNIWDLSCVPAVADYLSPVVRGDFSKQHTEQDVKRRSGKLHTPLSEGERVLSELGSTSNLSKLKNSHF